MDVVYVFYYSLNLRFVQRVYSLSSRRRRQENLFLGTRIIFLTSGLRRARHRLPLTAAGLTGSAFLFPVPRSMRSAMSTRVPTCLQKTDPHIDIGRCTPRCFREEKGWQTSLIRSERSPPLLISLTLSWGRPKELHHVRGCPLVLPCLSVSTG